MSGQSPFRDTIFALSSGGLPSGVAVVRMSGPHVGAALEAVAGRVPPARVATLCRLRDSDGRQIDRGLVLFFAGPASFTGEDCGELHVHGGRAVVATLLRRLGGLPDLRQAEAGEFTRRAFLNGKIDLTGAEGLADLLAAETDAQRRLAVENAEGGQRALYADWRSRLVHARAMIEAELDFADEADVDGSVSERIWKDLGELSEEIARHCTGFSAAEIVREGFRVALMGAPNAGKSSLLNALARREVAIVTDVPGTTRDPIEIALDLRGLKVVVTDTAGLRDTEDTVERIGVSRALEVAARADLVLELIDIRNDSAKTLVASKPVLRIGTKCDLARRSRDAFDLKISVVTGEGIAALLDMIAVRAENVTAASSSVVPTRLRHIELLEETRRYIAAALSPKALELRAEDLRLASESLGRIIGAIDVEDLLDVIFSQFCIGK